MPSDEQFGASSQDTTIAIWLRTDSGATVDVERVCEQLMTEFPGAVITTADSFATKRLLIEQAERELNVSFHLLLASNRRAHLRSGPKKDIAIPLGSGTQLMGDVCAGSILCRGVSRRSDATVEKLVRFLEALNVGNVEVIDLGVRN